MVKKETPQPQLRERLDGMISKIRSNWNNPSRLDTLLNEWEEQFGPEVHDMVREIIAEKMREVWASIAEEEESNTIEDLIRTLWESLREAGGEFTVEETEDGVQIYCTQCPIAETYKKIKREEYGLLFHCITDPYIVEGFNPEIKFRRTKTLMGGDDCCDHHYSMKKD
ncbi:MAG: L-2-amino-thiazoline-4-carboxylic acid hydrolase [Theionarchaea archaeon]|nr:L-2-amino-thiazoline-4-carboxylic acid hydrolase [Theionarchaea archaeon]